MRFEEGQLYHVYNRGNNKQLIFLCDEDYKAFLQKIRHHLILNCDILSWCLMPNHFHLLVRVNGRGCSTRETYGSKPIQELSFQIGLMLSSYSQRLNRREGRTGSLFQQKTKAKSVISLFRKQSIATSEYEYLCTLIQYIHENPLRAGTTQLLRDWPYSSFPDICGLRGGTLCNKKQLFEAMNLSKERFNNLDWVSKR